jgi:hypothetical protein
MPDPSTPFRFAYRLNLADYLALNEARRRLGPFGRFARPARYLIWYGLLIAMLWLMDSFRDGWRVYLEWEIAIWIPVVLAIPFLIDLVFDHGVLRWYFHRNAASKADITVDVDDEGVRWTMGHAAGQMAWAGIPDHVVMEDRVFLFLDKLQGITVPRRGLIAGDWDAFLGFVRDKARKAA